MTSGTRDDWAREDLAAWLRITLTDGVGPATACQLMSAFGLPGQVFAQTEHALAQVVGAGLARALRQEPDGLAQIVEDTWQWLSGGAQDGQPERHILTLADACYPRALLEISDPPPLLYALGRGVDRLADLSQRALAIVGSRNPTPQGERHARAFARSAAGAGVVVVSGLALGVDGAAHQGALDGADASMQAPVGIAVVGTGLDRVYPRQHKALAHALAQRGLILSECPLGTPPLAANFPRRNRILAALSRGTLVVEAALQSGSLITARLAVEQGRDVFAIPGSIDSPQSRGCHALIRQGARLVESARDILEEWNWPRQALEGLASAPTGAAAAGARAEFAPLLAALGHGPIGLDELLARTGIDLATLQAHLMALELDGAVARLPGGRFQRQAAA